MHEATAHPPADPIVLVALVVGDRVIAILAGIVDVFGLPVEVVLGQNVGFFRGPARELLINVVVFVVASLVLRWLVRWWINAGHAQHSEA